MRDSFFSYYPPSPDQYEHLWTKGLIVLDTNVLLNLYRLPTTARDEFLQVLEELKARLWVPYQVALEFQRNRLSVISSERRTTEAALQLSEDLISQVRQKVTALQIDKYDLGIDPKPLLEELEQANGKLIEAIKGVHQSQIDITASDPIREKIDAVLGDQVGPAPMSQADLDELVSNGDDRYANKIPPGFSDADKEKNPHEATFVHNGIKYHKKFGDLILWQQFISHAKQKGIDSCIFVTSDKKDDWWWREQGKTIGPHPEIINEAKREAGIKLFWMYSSVQFLEHAKQYTKTNVSEKSLDDLRKVLLSDWRWNITSKPEHVSRIILDPISHSMGQYYSIAERSVYNWLTERFGEVIRSQSFPDFVAIKEDDVSGFEIKLTRNFQNFVFSTSLVNSILRGYMEVKEGRLTAFTLVLVISEDDFISALERVDELNHKLTNLLTKYPITGIIVGTVHDDGTFEVLAHQLAPQDRD